MLAEPLGERNRGIGCATKIVRRCVRVAINVVRDNQLLCVDYWHGGEWAADARTK